MIECPVSLRFADRVVHATSAWFIPGGNAADWLAEIERWQIPTAAIRLYVLPASLSDRTPAGVLVVGPDTPSLVERAQPYGRLARRLYLPADAHLHPPMTDDELSALLRLQVQVFHPSVGLIGFEERDGVRVADLLSPPAERRCDWGLAKPGEHSSPRLRAVEPMYPPQIALVLALGRDDIGSEPPAELPPAPGESPLRDKLKRSLAAPALGVAAAGLAPLRLLAFLSEKLRGKPASQPSAGQQQDQKGSSQHAATPSEGPGWARRLHDSLAAKLGAMTQNLFDHRRRALERLKQMLETDPDEGLRHAISLRQIPGRGVAAPSAGLPTRDIRFSLSSALGGGSGPADAWDIPPDTVQTLKRQYRDAANRELRLGRYQRAAYIFAELLGDYSSAANALEQGRHFREAAILYRDKLSNPRRAAACLQAGGLLVEAAVAWTDLQEYETAGDLYAKLDQAEEAQRCYRQAVAKAMGRPDLLLAARLLEIKCEAPDEALRLLEAAWPADPAAARCLKASFELMGRLGRRQSANARVAMLRKHPPSAAIGVTLVETLSAIAGDYPDATVRENVADATRVVAAGLLPSQGAADVKRIAVAVGNLVPADRLLSRDARRYADQHRNQIAGPAVRSVVVLRQSRFAASSRWVAVTAIDGGLCAVGWTSDYLATVAAERWFGGQAAAHINRPSGVDDQVQLCQLPNSRVVLGKAAGPIPDVTLRWDAETARDDMTNLTVRWPTCLPAGLFTANERGVVWHLCEPGGQDVVEPVLTAFDANNGYLLSSHSLALPWPADAVSAIAAVRDEVYIGWGRDVLCYAPTGPSLIEPMRGLVRDLVTSHGPTDRKVVATLDEGCALIHRSGGSRFFAQDFSEPLAVFLRSDKIVVIDGGRPRGRVYAMRDDTDVVQIADFTFTGEPPIAVVPTDYLDQFATVTADGLITVYQSPDK